MLFTMCLGKGHPWIREDGVAPDKPIDSAVLSRMKQFTAMNKLKKMALRVKLFSHIFPFFLHSVNHLLHRIFSHIEYNYHHLVLCGKNMDM